MQDDLCEKSKHRREPLELPASEPAGEATLKLFSNVDDRILVSFKKWLGFVTNVELDWLKADKKETFFHEDGFLNFAVADPGTTLSRTYRSRRQGHIELPGAGNSLNSALSCPWKAFVKREFHSLPELVAVVDPRMRSSSEIESRQVFEDGAVQADAKVMLEQGTGQSTQEQVLKPSTDIKETSLQKEEKEAVMSQSASKASVKDNASLLDEKNNRRDCGNLFSVHPNDTASTITPSLKKKLGQVHRSYGKGYFAFMEKRQNKTKRKKKKFWNADQQLGPDDLKHLSLAPHLDQIATAGTNSGRKMPRMHFLAGISQEKLFMSRIASQVKYQESIGCLGTFDANLLKTELKENQSNSLEQELSKQVECVEHVEEGDIHGKSTLEGDLKITHTKPLKDSFHEKGSSELKILSFTQLMGNRQKSDTDMEPNIDKGGHVMEINGKAKHACNEDALYLLKNKGEVIVDDGYKASTSSGSAWTNVQMQTFDKGMDNDLREYTEELKVRYPLKNLDFKDFYIIFDLNGVLIKRWDTNPSLPGVFKLNRRWIQLRPGCIEFLCKLFAEFRVGIWSTMTQKNVLGVCRFLEQQAHQPLPFFMLWSKESCYQHRGVRRPDKSRVAADFKPLSRVWSFFKPYLGSHNTLLIDDSPYKACMNNPYNCIFPDAYGGCTNDDYLNNVLWPHLQKMKLSQNTQAYVANNPLGQQPIVVGHQLYYHVQQVMDLFHNTLSTGTSELIGKV